MNCTYFHASFGVIMRATAALWLCLGACLTGAVHFPPENRHVMFSAFGFDVHRGAEARKEDLVSCILEAAFHKFRETGAQVRFYASQVNAWRAKDWELFEKHGISIDYVHMDVRSLFDGTPLETWYSSGHWRSYAQPYMTLTDATRLALVYKLGGIYADLDILFTNITYIGEVQRWLAQDGGEPFDETVKLNSAVLRMPQHDPFLEYWMDQTAKCPTTDSNSVPCGPGLETKIWKEICRDSRKASDKKLCGDMVLMPRYLTHRWQWDQYGDLEKPGTEQDWTDALDAGMQAVHFRRAGTGGECLPRNSALAKGFKDGCPAVLEAYGHRLLCPE